MKSDVMRPLRNNGRDRPVGSFAAIAAIPVTAEIAVQRDIVVECQARRRSLKPLRSFASLGGMTAMQ